MPQLINNISQLTADAVNQFKKALGNPQPGAPDSINKAITQSTGLVWYDLQAPAKNLFPVITPLRNSVPRVSGNGGTATNWIAVTGINTTSLNGFVPEGVRNGVVTTAVSPKSASYKAFGLEDSVTFEADLAAVNFEDIRSTTAQRLLWATMIQEELSILGGNGTDGVALGTPTAPTVTVDAAGGSIGAGTYNVIVVALTLMGYQASSLSGGVVGSVSVTSADGSSFSYGGGSSQKSSATSTGAITGATNSISAYTPVVTGAVAYAWYVGTASAEKLEAITTINSVEITSLAGTGQAASAITADNSTNAYAFNGILYQAWDSGSNSYIANLATGTEGVGTPLASDSAGGITQIDTMLQSLWDNYRLGPDAIYVNSQEAKNITNKIVAGGAAPLFRFVTDNPGSGMQNLTAGSLVGNYLNKFAMGGGQLIPIRLHPYMPPGTMVAVTETLPYPINNVPNVMEMKLRRDYYQMEWPLRTRKYETGVYFDGVLAHYFPPSIGIITNIGNG